jgi:hypothetical protein
MSVRRKLNGLYLSGCAVLGAFVGFVFASWWACAATFAVATGAQVLSGNVRFSGPRR